LSASVPLEHEQLGELVRISRVTAAMSQGDLAAAVGCGQSKIAKIESGDIALKSDDLEKIIGAARIEPVRAAEMRSMLAMQPPALWNGHRSFIPSWFRRFFRDERQASVVRAWHSERFPVLYQHESYSLAMFAVHKPAEIQSHLNNRDERQALLRSGPRPEYHLMFSESSFRRTPDGAEVAIDQALHLLALAAEHDWLHLRVVPFDAPIRFAAADFTIVSFRAKRDYVYVEHLTGAHYLKKPADLDEYREYWDYLDGAALDDVASVEFLEQLVVELRERMSR